MLYAMRAPSWQRGIRIRRKSTFFISTLRSAFVILLYIFISWLVNRNQKDDPLFTVLGNCSKRFVLFRICIRDPCACDKLTAFQASDMPNCQTVNSRLISAYAGQLPVTVIVLLIEHIANIQIFWSHQQLYHQSFPGACRHWVHKHSWSISWCLPSHRLFHPDGHQVKGWCAYAVCRASSRPYWYYWPFMPFPLSSSTFRALHLLPSSSMLLVI